MLFSDEPLLRNYQFVTAATPARVGYRADIDGLRAIAVLSVLLYHADIALVPGGFVGVDVFFVISGYLIMQTLASDIRCGRFSIPAFYERRIRRILPALFGMTIFSSAAAAMLFPPDAFAQFGRSLVAMTLFASNILFCFEPREAAGYFATATGPQLLLHTWSLAVEEQFYIILPLGLALLRRHSERVTVLWLIALASLTFGLSLWAVEAWPLGAFYLVFFRAWELLIGSLLALKVAPALPGRASREAASALGLGLILAADFGFTRQTVFPGAAALLPCIGAWLVIHANASGPTLVARSLACAPLVAIGLISYSLYLWHWPITVLVKHLNVGRLTAVPTAFIIITSVVAGYLSYRFIECPFRSRHALMSRRQLFRAAAGGGFVAGLAGILIVTSAGLPQRFDPRTRSLIADNLSQEFSRPSGLCQNWQAPVRRVSDIVFCPVGAGAKRNILFWGDSHVGVLQPLVQNLHDEGFSGGRGAIFAVAAGCPPVMRLTSSQPGYHCQAFARLALERAKASDIDAVFIGFSALWQVFDGKLCLAQNDHCTDSPSRREQQEIFVEDLRTEVRALRAAGKRVILSLPVPAYSRRIPQFEINQIVLGRVYPALVYAGVIRALERHDFTSLRTRILALAAETGAKVFDPSESLCHAGACVYERDHISIYTDESHLASTQIGMLHDGLRSALN